MLPTILLQADAAPNPWWGNLILIGGIIIIFYFFMVRPQQRKQKQHKSFVESMKRGDRVITIGGIHGRVVEFTEDTVVVDVDRGTKMTFEKSAISVEASKKINPVTPTKAEA